MVKTTVDYSNKEDEEVKKKLTYIYSYGINMLTRGAQRPRRHGVRVRLQACASDSWLLTRATRLLPCGATQALSAKMLSRIA